MALESILGIDIDDQQPRRRPTLDFFALPLGTLAGAVGDAIVLIDGQQCIVAAAPLRH